MEELGFDDFNYFSALVFTAMRTGTMGSNFFMTVGTLRHLRCTQSIVRAAGRRSLLGMTAFWIRHTFSFLNSIYVSGPDRLTPA